MNGIYVAYSLAAFFVITLGLGFLLRIFGFTFKDPFEGFFAIAGFGLVMIPVIGTLLNILRIPIDVRLFLSLAAAILLWGAYRHFTQGHRFHPSLSSLKTVCHPSHILLCIIVIVTLFMYVKGSFIYPYLEDSDPWRYASATKFIEIERTLRAPFRFTDVAEPYPQAYQMIMALLSQANQSISWTLKFFNSFFASLTLVYFYLTAWVFIKNRYAALFGTVALASMPAWLSHFIFPIPLASLFFLIFLYMLGKREMSPVWRIPCTVAFASLWLVHFYSSFVITLIFVLYYLVKAYSTASLQKPLLRIGLQGFVASIALFWAHALWRHRETPAPGGPLA